MSQKKVSQGSPDPSPKNTGLKGMGSAAEKKEHQESLKRLKKYKKKRKQQVIGLILESVLLCVVIVAYVGVSYVYNTLSKFSVADDPSASATTVRPVSTLPIVGPGGKSTETPSTPPYVIPGSETESIPEETWPNDPSGEVEYTYPEVTIPDRNGFYTFVIFGIDARDTERLLKGTQGDVCIIASINKETGDVRLASVYRDYCIEVNPETHRKFTDCYAHYGAAEMVNILNRNLDLNITHFVAVNWLCLADIVDALGGLDVELSEAEAEKIDWYVWETAMATGRSQDTDYMFLGNFHPDESKEIGYYLDGYHAGVWHLNGIQTVSYSRLRYGLGDDYKRTERQRIVINLIIEKAKTAGVGKIIEIINLLADNKIRTSLPMNEITALAMQYKKYHMGPTSGFPSNHIASTPELKYYIFTTDLVNQVKGLHQMLYDDFDYVPSENVQRIADYMNGRINGTIDY